MGIKPTFTSEDVSKTFKNFLKTIEGRMIKRLQYLGEMCVEHARTLPPEIGFRDQTGNLRSSIGYMVFNHGVAVHQGGFEVVLTGSSGAATGVELAKKVGARYPDDISLVVVAGMNYALALEANGAFKVKSRRSYDVLASAELLAEKELPRMINDLVSNIKKATE